MFFTNLKGRNPLKPVPLPFKLLIMADKKMVFNLAKDLHYKAGVKHPCVSIDTIATQLQLSMEEVTEHLNMLKTLRLIRFAESNPGGIEITKIGLSTKVG